MARALVTGANGFVGSHLAELLLERGWEVRCLARKSSPVRWLPRSGVEIAWGEVTDPGSLPAALRNVDVVFHLAGVVRAPDEAAYLRVNAQGTRNLARAAAAAETPPRRILLMSSLAAVGPTTRDHPRREDDPPDPQGGYGRSKLRAEAALAEAAGGVPWTVVRPGAVYGPRDDAFLLLAKLVRRGWFPQVGREPQPVQIVHVRDAAEGSLAAAESPRSVGRVYHLAHPEPATWESLGRIMAARLGRPVRRLPVPRWAVGLLARGSSLLSSATGRANHLPGDRLRGLLVPAWTCDVSRLREEVGFTAGIDAGAGVPATVDWYREVGWL